MSKVKLNLDNFSKLEQDTQIVPSKITWAKRLQNFPRQSNSGTTLTGAVSKKIKGVGNTQSQTRIRNLKFDPNRSKQRHRQVEEYEGPSLISSLIGVIFLLWGFVQPYLSKFMALLKIHTRENLVRAVVLTSFFLIVGHLANLQIAGFYGQAGQNSPDSILVRRSVIENQKRGQIYIQDQSRNQQRIPLTSTQILANLSIDPLELKKIIDKGTSIEEIAQTLSGSLNIPYSTVYETIKYETGRENPGRYVVISRFISEQQKRIANSLIQDRADKRMFFTWLSVRETLRRTYPQGNMLASTVGYMTKYNVSREEAMRTECRGVVEDNERNGVPSRDYAVGYYGLEQKYCSILAGRNGRTVFFGSQLQNDDSLAPQNGSDLYLTIDMTLQQKAEELLERAIRENSNQNGKPRNGSIIVMNPKTGKILALASSPSFDPNDYSQASAEAFRNVATSEDYEVGSSMKPLTVAAALSEYEKGTTGSQGQRIGISPTWAKRDYDKQGKIYKALNGEEVRITNSQNVSYSGRINDLKLTIRDSINTMISDITDSLGNVKLREYFEDKLEFNKPTEATFAGGGTGNLTSLDKNIECQYCYAQHGFGQGFAISPIQLMRAYTAIANNGKMVEPYLIDKIVDQDGRVDDGSAPDSLLLRQEPKQVFTEQSSRLVTEYMKAVIDEGYLNETNGRNSIPGYSVAAKTGTAQITRSHNGKFCDYSCNTQLGLFDHTLIGFGPTRDAQVMVIVKLSEPRPGVISNFADTTTMPAFKDMMSYSLEYLKVPKDR